MGSRFQLDIVPNSSLVRKLRTKQTLHMCFRVSSKLDGSPNPSAIPSARSPIRSQAESSQTSYPYVPDDARKIKSALSASDPGVGLGRASWSPVPSPLSKAVS